MPLLNLYSQSPRGPLPAEPGRLQNSLHISPNLPAKAQGSRGRCSWCACTLPLGVPVCCPVSRGDHAATQGAAGGRCRCRSPSQPPPAARRCGVLLWPRPPACHTRSRGFEGRAAAAGPQLVRSCSCHAGCGQLRAPAPSPRPGSQSMVGGRRWGCCDLPPPSLGI